VLVLAVVAALLVDVSCGVLFWCFGWWMISLLLAEFGV